MGDDWAEGQFLWGETSFGVRGASHFNAIEGREFFPQFSETAAKMLSQTEKRGREFFPNFLRPLQKMLSRKKRGRELFPVFSRRPLQNAKSNEKGGGSFFPFFGLCKIAKSKERGEEFFPSVFAKAPRQRDHWTPVPCLCFFFKSKGPREVSFHFCAFG